MLTEEQKKQIEIENEKMSSTLVNIANRIVVLSGKGGVGKTTISINLACGLNLQGHTTGILDADVTGPNVPKMLGITDKLYSFGNKIIPHDKYGIKIVSIAGMVSDDQPIIWRGPMRSKLLNQFIGGVKWGNLDFLIADLPPGTGDEIITMTTKLKPEMAIIVTTPQEVSLIDSRRAIAMVKKMGISNIGLIENMSGLFCPNCGHNIDLFGTGGGSKQAKEMDIEFLGSLPTNIETRKASDKGKPIVIQNDSNEISKAMMKIVERIENQIAIAEKI
jgi:Mrp family chromosome partitioning ATPase